MEYICIKKASESKVKQPGTGTIISYYRKYKSTKIIKNEDDIINKILEMNTNNDSEGYGEDGTICPICMLNKRNHIFYPCKHKFCQFCAEKVMESYKCPICRSMILISFDIAKYEK